MISARHKDDFKNFFNLCFYCKVFFSKNILVSVQKIIFRNLHHILYVQHILFKEFYVAGFNYRLKKSLTETVWAELQPNGQKKLQL